MATKSKRSGASASPATAAPLADAPAPPPAAERKRKVFLVDDHPMVRERLAELIAQEADLSVCGEAEDSVTAVRLIGQLQPDVAIVDITLKDAYGIELVKQLKDRESHIPVLVLS